VLQQQDGFRKRDGEGTTNLWHVVCPGRVEIMQAPKGCLRKK